MHRRFDTLEKIEHPPNKAIVLRNSNCCYCGKLLSEVGSTKEHVIGRNFVPKTTLEAQWNLILGACPNCNGEKSNLEDDISAVTMQPDAFGRFAAEDPRLKAEAQRKLRSFNRRTQKSMAKSKERLKATHEFASGVTFTFEMSAPPQVDDERIFQLARFHIQGFFF